MRKPRSEYPSEQADKFLLRFPNGLRDRIKTAADANGRSMNAEIINVLEQQYPPELSADELIADLEFFGEMYAARKSTISGAYLRDVILRLKEKLRSEGVPDAALDPTAPSTPTPPPSESPRPQVRQGVRRKMKL
jgi:plasmid stability protein